MTRLIAHPYVRTMLLMPVVKHLPTMLKVHSSNPAWGCCFVFEAWHLGLARRSLYVSAWLNLKNTIVPLPARVVMKLHGCDVANTIILIPGAVACLNDWIHHPDHVLTTGSLQQFFAPMIRNLKARKRATPIRASFSNHQHLKNPQ